VNAPADVLGLRPLWSDGPPVTFLGYGAMELRGGAEVHRRPRPLAREVAYEVLNTVLDEGITFIDTSIDYGLSEEIIGAAISARRDEFLVATKAGCPLEHRPDASAGTVLVHDFSPDHIRQGLEQSLRRLRTDHVDLLQLHASPAPEVLEQEGTLAALVKLREEGKVRAIGISSTLPHLPAHLQITEFQAYQLPYSPFERQLEPYLAAAGERSAGVIVRGGVAQGLSRPKPAGGADVDPKTVALDDLLDGDTVPGFLLRLQVSNENISTVIAGSANPDHVRSNARAVRRGPLPADTAAEAWRRLDAAGFVAGQ
jgi:aryl-alcohol dehydrogenase-like predicted oxidoreductase